MANDTEKPDPFSCWLQEALRISGMTQAELTRRLPAATGRPIDRNAVNRMVLGTRAISARELYAVASVCRVALPSAPDALRVERVA